MNHQASLPTFLPFAGHCSRRFSCLAVAWVFVALAWITPLLRAQSPGVVTGTVLNPGTQRFLERAEVRVLGTALSALTDSEGTFRILGVPAGTQQLIATYTGLDEGKTTVTVPAGGTARADFELKSDVYRLGQFVVATDREGNAAAINAQRQAEAYRNIASTDAFGDITFGNPGDFLKSLPGIQMDYVGSDPRTITIRGMDPSLTVVTMDGNKQASASSSSVARDFEIDQISIGSIETVEVYKAAIPSMPANAVGGQVNFVTKSAFEQKGRRLRLTLNATASSEQLDLRKTQGPNEEPSVKIKRGGALSYSESFLNNRLGLAVNLTGTTVWYPIFQVDNSFAYAAPLPAFPAPYTADTPRARRNVYQAYTNQQYIKRNGYSVNLDFKVNNDVTAFLRTAFTDYFTMNRSLSMRLRANTVSPDFSVTDLTALPRTGNTTSNAELTTSFHEKISRTFSVSPGLRYKSGPWRADLNLGYSLARNHYQYPDFFNVVNMLLPEVGFRQQTPATTAVPTSLVQTAGLDYLNIANYRPQNPNFTSNNERKSKAKVWSAQLNSRRDFSARFPYYLKTGVSYQHEQRMKDQPQQRWAYVGPDGLANTADDTANMAQFGDTTGARLARGLPSPVFVSPWRVYDYFAATPRAFTEDVAYNTEQRIIQRLQLGETITAGYVMGKVAFGRLDVLLGTRVERTDVNAKGPRRQDSKVPAGVNPNSVEGILAKYSRLTATTRYTTDPLKYLHLTYRAADGWQPRASYSETIGRPDYSAIFPNLNVNDTTRIVTLNNTQLLPQRSTNYDLGFEYYFKPAGQFSVAWFHKDIADYISTDSSTISAEDPNVGISPELIGYQLNTQRNLGSAKWQGLEVDGRLQLRRFAAVPSLLRGVDLFGNYTHLYKLEGNFGGTRTITQLANVSPRLYNAGISFRSPGGKFFVQWKSTFTSAFLLSNTGAAAQSRQQRDAALRSDAEMRYRFSKWYEVIVTGRNVTNELQKNSEMDGRVARHLNDIGAWYSLAVNVDL